MLNDGVLLVILLNFGYIALLPRKFFRKASITLQFWLTAAPMFAAPALLALAYYGILPPLVERGTLSSTLMMFVAIFATTASMILLGMAIGTHRIPLHMFHDADDKKVSHLVTYGPYRFIRHPLYASYLYALFAAMMFCPQVGTIGCFIYGVVSLTTTAKAEEERMCQSEDLGPEYREYLKYSGRFLPPLGAISLTQSEQKAEQKAEHDAAEAKANAAKASDGGV